VSEDTYKKIADEYLREYGKVLRRELEEIERRPSMPEPLSVDLRVRRGIAAHKRARYIKYTGLIAACLAIALLTPFILRFYPSRTEAPGADFYSPAPVPPPTEKYEVLPLSFSIQNQFNVASVEQDAEKTIYHLNDNKLDDVIVTMERSGDISRYDTLVELSVGGRDAFGSSGDGYNLLAFRDDDSDILYVLTCKYDINTLVLLGESIQI